jgi:signal transduction histidine kinase
MAFQRHAEAASVSASSQSSVGEALSLETLVIQLAGALVRVTVDYLDAEINLWLKRIGMDLGLDRSTIAEINPLTGVASFTHGWARAPYPLIGQPLDATRLLPWTTQQMLAGQTVVMASPDKLPKEAAIDRENFLRYGPKSNVIVPIMVGGTVVGAMSFASLRQARSWPQGTVSLFRAVSEIFGFGLERKRAVAETLGLRSQLSYVSRISMMGELAASMAHELNQPLGAILNNAEALQAILASECPDLEEIRAGIADIIQDDNRARDTIQRVWALFLRGEVTKSQVNIDELLTEIGRIVRTDALLRKISFKIDLTRPLPRIFGERVQLQQAIINLILNAFDAVASNDDGPREVRVEALARTGNEVELVVRDSGPGIASHTLPRIFEPFFSTKSRGLGMGLAITKSIIDAHGGKLSVSSNSDRGTTFVIRLPIATGDTT